MHVISQIIVKNLSRVGKQQTGLWINPATDSSWRMAQEHCALLGVFCQDYAASCFHRQAGAAVQFGAIPQPPEPGNPGYQWILLNLPRHRALLEMMLECTAGLLTETGVLWLAGENRTGIKSAERLLRNYFGHVSKLDNARHCTLYSAHTAHRKDPFNALSHRRNWHFECRQTEIEVCSYPGVFSHGRLDNGTALLLTALTATRQTGADGAAMEVHGNVLDFGCGAGVIGACLATGNTDVCITCLDSNALALRACRETLTVNHLDGTVLASDGFMGVDQAFDLIITNPPIHAGVKTDNDLARRLLEPARHHLKPGGKLVLVANRHLPYEGWLAVNFRQLSVLAENSHFKVIAAQQ